MRGRWIALWGCLVVALAGTVAACGDDDSGSGGSSGSSDSGGGGTLKIYSSLPLQGSQRPQSQDVVKGIKLALKQHNNKAGKYTIEYTSLDDSTAASGNWDAAQTKSNARKAAQDDKTIAYIGEFNSGASANSIPTLNEAGILQVSPSNTALGLTKSGDGATPGEPDKYYPTGKRNYGRVVPIDTIQGEALAQYAKDQGVTKMYVLDDTEVYGKGIAANTITGLKKVGIEVVGQDEWDGKAANYRALAAKVKASGADGVLGGGIISENGPQLFKDMHAALPDAKLFGPDGMATTDFTKEIPADVQAATYLTAPTVDPDELPAAGQKFYKDFEAAYGEKPDEIDPYAVYGYEAANNILDDIAKGGDDRQKVIDAFFATDNRDSPLGPYSIDDDGDTTLTTYGAYIAKGGKLVFSKSIKQSS